MRDKASKLGSSVKQHFKNNNAKNKKSYATPHYGGGIPDNQYLTQSGLVGTCAGVASFGTDVAIGTLELGAKYIEATGKELTGYRSTSWSSSLESASTAVTTPDNWNVGGYFDSKIFSGSFKVGYYSAMATSVTVAVADLAVAGYRSSISPA